jgi:hypothetical protein
VFIRWKGEPSFLKLNEKTAGNPSSKPFPPEANATLRTLFLAYDLYSAGACTRFVEQLNIKRILAVRQLLVAIDRIRSILSRECNDTSVNGQRLVRRCDQAVKLDLCLIVRSKPVNPVIRIEDRLAGRS